MRILLEHCSGMVARLMAVKPKAMGERERFCNMAFAQTVAALGKCFGRIDQQKALEQQEGLASEEAAIAGSEDQPVECAKYGS